ncbi:hypothetical protein F3J14_01200 [Burkholderia sp. Tr-862]|uniref:hypothetical protein n=1 Tax=Burkholderia sp. Tr-862 TaxID=2608331 RepID=UPI0014197FF2|nr:hypothetical protein [Burkholderia sp. Tr-862]NIF39542.1 hypothetical protein [Burkholderia sp. Tr-862]
MNIGAFKVLLSLCGYPQTGPGAGGGAVKPTGLLAQSSVAASITGSTVETTLASIVVPANSINANGALRITTMWSYTNSANAKVLKLTFGGATFLNQPQTTTLSNQAQTIIRNRGVTNSQVGFAAAAANQYSSSGASPVTAAVDTTQDQTIAITATLVNAGETITLESYTVEVLNP